MITLLNLMLSEPEMEMRQWVVGHGSNGSPFLDGSHGSLPVTH